jgi:hypothetical protein
MSASPVCHLRNVFPQPPPGGCVVFRRWKIGYKCLIDNGGVFREVGFSQWRTVIIKIDDVFH